MSTFDPYYKWLAIPPAEQPPHHYRLLGVPLFDADMEVIEAAADRQMAYVHQCATGEYVTESQRILNELSAARVCLLNPVKKKQYDNELRRRLNSATTGGVSHDVKDAPRTARHSVRDDKRSGRYFDVAGWRVERKQIATGLCFIVALIVGVSYAANYLSQGPAAGDGLSLRPDAVDAARNPVVEAAKTPQPRHGFLRFTQADGVEIADTAGLLDSGGSFTLELWARWADDGQPQYIVSDEGLAGNVSRVDRSPRRRRVDAEQQPPRSGCRPALHMRAGGAMDALPLSAAGCGYRQRVATHCRRQVSGNGQDFRQWQDAGVTSLGRNQIHLQPDEHLPRSTQVRIW